MSEATVSVLPGWRPALRFSDRIRMVRLQYGEKLGRRIDGREMAALIGVPHGSWASWENGRSSPLNAVLIVQSIVELTGVNAAWLLGLDRFDPNQGTPNLPVGWNAPELRGRDSNSQPNGLPYLVALADAA